MERRDFLKTASAAAAALTAQGYLPLLAGEKRKKRPRAARRPKVSGTNIFTEPCAIEPITGYLPKFAPATTGTMQDSFTARYTLVSWQAAGATSKNGARGSLSVTVKGNQCQTTETRANRPANTVKANVQCKGELRAASTWKLSSTIAGAKDLSFEENGTWDGKSMTVKSSAWTQTRTTTRPLISRWDLLPLLASGRVKASPVTFDMLDDATLRAGQTLRFAGEISIPTKGGKVRLDSYVQTGQGIVPTHYLVDRGGRVQLITMAFVNWALTELKGHAK